jgi:hypothetical protein
VVRRASIFLAAWLAAAAAIAANGAEATSRYAVQFRLELTARQPSAKATIRVMQFDAGLRSLRLRLPADVFTDVAASGSLTRRADTFTWKVPPRGGELRYSVVIDHARDSDAYDALVTDRWAIFRADDLFPAASVRKRKGATGRGELLLDVPAGWRALTPYVPAADGRLLIDRPNTAYDRPIGWIAVGELGSRKDMIGGMLVTIAAPKHQSVQRLPMMALLRWTLPLLQSELEQVPPALLVVSADDPMWRGGLSAPNSLFLHASRPLISENGTSTLMHELLHVLMPVPAAAEDDWIDEGLAEYLGLVLLERSGTISRERFDHAINTFRRRGAAVRNIRTRYASGRITARAVATFHELDRELQQATNGESDLFDLTRKLMQEPRPVDLQRLRVLAAEIAGGRVPQALSAARIPTQR